MWAFFYCRWYCFAECDGRDRRVRWIRRGLDVNSELEYVSRVNDYGRCQDWSHLRTSRCLDLTVEHRSTTENFTNKNGVEQADKQISTLAILPMTRPPAHTWVESASHSHSQEATESITQIYFASHYQTTKHPSQHPPLMFSSIGANTPLDFNLWLELSNRHLWSGSTHSPVRANSQ
jgi:hypothetical protein